MVGGSSNHFTANYWRLHEIDFHERSVLGGIAGTGFADWPISYQDLEPYYTKVEWEVGVSGLASASPFDPPRTQALSDAAAAGEVLGRAVRARCTQARLSSFSRAPGHRLATLSWAWRVRTLRLLHGLRLRDAGEVLGAVHDDSGSRGDRALRDSSESYVFRVEINERGRTTGVHYFDRDKRENFQKARAVVVSANGAETPRLLLNSTSSRFPQGLANSSGLVGKYLMFNQGCPVHAVFEHELNEYKSVQVSRVLHDFYDSEPSRGFYGGGGIDARIGVEPVGWALASGGELPRWGAPLKARLEAFTHSMTSDGHCTSLAVESNSVSIDPTIKDPWGIPAIRITYKDHPDDLATSRFLQDRAFEIMQAAGAQKIWRDEVRLEPRRCPPAWYLPHGQ